ncbi:ribbon-helix-helix protein, CopG family [Xenorhabdus sp. Reich]|uniref:Ribbon-helix-helix protein, CopG family n=1 Tax=Xenorhabdus littoralis TaxID=2582835 RepID=A0ABU4SI96_9GAMM|nr:ribbon-helix-helix domain-containing protein [Xenorhabdus sp. Reich]MDX7998382.1 ribbon-helix-helix protein, CopG family [Xenorhabdus sp. Reich]
MTTKTMSVKLDTVLQDKIKSLAGIRRRSAHWLMKEAISQYVEREEKREIVKQEAYSSWAEYQRTGLHVTFEEADEWLSTLEEGKDAEAPECHQ